MTAFDRLAAALSDRYRIERELGAGGMATVYLAEDLKHQRQVAIKVLKPELAAVLGAERFIQEITTTAQLQHPNILPLFDSGRAVAPREGGGGDYVGGEVFLYYVMPYVAGESLRDKLDREKQLGVDEAVKITTEVADALAYAHSHGVVHRDIKPENILLHAGRPMVADFGIALAVSAAAGGRMTETGLSLGTPHYMSPEQATAEKDITGRSDVYSLASVLYEMLTGDPPHTGKTAQQIIAKIIADEARPVRQVRKSVPPNVAAALGKALEKLPADRFVSAKAFSDALADSHFATGSAGAAASAAPARQRRLVAGLGVFATAMTAVAAWALLRPIPEPPVIRYALSLPAGQTPAWDGFVTGTSDGSRLVYRGPALGGQPGQLWVKARDRVDAVPLAGTAGATAAAVSPDNQSLAFVRSSNLLRMPLAGGPGSTL
ncbi:MAG: serine/threonine protein kinase, partial [Gemmatimonadetes bacterium]|nr:serine/threonine protein kinase [Gemmatimonadota bacterium]